MVKKGINKIAVQVYRFSSGSWLEDQDYWRFSGIFRDVELLFVPKTNLSDLRVQTLLKNNYSEAFVEVDLNLIGQLEKVWLK